GPGPVRVYLGRKTRRVWPSTVPSPIQYQDASHGVTSDVGADVVPPWIVATSRVPRSTTRSLLIWGASPGLLASAPTVPRKVSEKLHAVSPFGSAMEYAPSAPVQSSVRVLSFP